VRDAARLAEPIVAVGLGTSGLASARFLRARGYSFTVTDSRAEPPARQEFARDFPGVVTRFGEFAPDLIARARTVILSPGINPAEPALAAAVRADAEIIGEVELFARHANAPVVAITGSNGKSTVTSLVGEIYRAAGRHAAVGGNLGTPATALWSADPPLAYVLELSSFQLETTHSLAPAVATVLNVSPDHLDRHGDLDRYAAVKARIFAGASLVVLNADDARVMAMARAGVPTVRFAASTDADAQYALRLRDDAEWLCIRGTPLIAAAALGMRGRHNLANVLAAFALADCMGLPHAALARAAAAFRGLPHRSQFVASHAGVDWVNDSKGTNVGATCAAIAGLDGYSRLVLIAGGEGKGQSFVPLAGLCGRLRAAVLIGVDAPRIAADLGSVVPIRFADSMTAAVRAAACMAVPGDAVLLSPACASFDMFRDYAARGDAYAAAVRALGSE
jgi:UDP-N-acetylmuramoylalanine--D-glutamate ligase